ncbi:sugar transferase [Plantactinospora siamensis]|uniref:Sugar transferase n=1 Tax=Plantactinospora siamensis TaxID=555372 RepID=A0ABV6P2U3_9ACTN
MIKRLFDVVVSAAALLLLLPVLLVLAAAVKLDDGGPVIFRQERAGRHGRTFRMHKLRTMRSGPGPQVTADSDDRITRVGRFLRATKLDELPQFYDVLVGHMSLVGPRPEVWRYVMHWPAAARHRILSVRPGITDPTQIAFRHESAELAAVERPEEYYLSVVLPRRVEMCLRYVENRSFLGDIVILLRTAQALVRPRPPVDRGQVAPATAGAGGSAA